MLMILTVKLPIVWGLQEHTANAMDKNMPGAFQFHLCGLNLQYGSLKTAN